MTHSPPPADDTTVVVPCYNEARRLDVRAFDEYLQRDNAVSLLLVDDGSTDDTSDVLEQLRARRPQRVTVFRTEHNVGKAEAVRRGVLLALRSRPAFVGYWDADLATPLAAIEQLRAVLIEQPELAMVLGSRVKLLGRRIERRLHRHLLGRVFATAASLTLRLPVYDTQCGAKLFRTSPLVAELFQRPFASRWVFDVELLARLAAAPRGVGAVPVEAILYEYPLETWRDVAGSQLQPHDFLIAAMDLAGIWWGYRRRGVHPAELPPTANRTAPRKAA